MAVSAVLDACVLYPVGLRDTLLKFAAGCFRVLWTEEILTETSRSIVEDTPGLSAEHLGKTFAAMRRAFPEAIVEDYEHLVGSMDNHPEDRHVLAAAVAAEADVIVTLNIRHFPSAACEPHGISIRMPDDLLCDIAGTWLDLVVAVLSAQAARNARPPMSSPEMLERLQVHVPRLRASFETGARKKIPGAPTDPDYPDRRQPPAWNLGRVSTWVSMTIGP